MFDKEKGRLPVCPTAEAAADDLERELQEVLRDGPDTGERHLLTVTVVSVDDPHLALADLQDHSTVPLAIDCGKQSTG